MAGTPFAQNFQASRRQDGFWCYSLCRDKENSNSGKLYDKSGENKL
jgi:quinol monooxygenase YgiN